MNPVKMFIVLVSLVALVGCAGINTFSQRARAGDTVAIAAGWMKTFTPTNLTVVITPSSGSPMVFSPGDPIIRAVTNMYIDPLSSIVVSRQTDQDLTTFGRSYSGSMRALFTGDDKDWWQTVVFIDLPTPLPGGLTQVDLYAPGGETATATLLIRGGIGTANLLEAEIQGPLQEEMLESLQRVPHYTVNFSTTGVVPHAVQVDMAHNPDVDNGGSGKTFVVNPIGYIKGTAWSDDGLNTRVILTPNQDGVIRFMDDFKFYVAGGISNLTVNTVQGFDINGDAVPGIFAVIVP